MKNTILPVHAVTGLQAVGWRKPRPGETGEQPIWPIAGGSSDNDDSGDDGDDDAGDDGDDDAGGDGKDDAGKDEEPDWKAKFEAQQRINRSLERRSKKDKATLDQLRGGKQPAKTGDKDDEPDPEKIRADARAEAKAEALKERVLDKIEAKAGGKFADAEDAVAILMKNKEADDFIDADGKIDVDAIKDALEELAKNKPHLLAQGKRFQGGADGGARQSKPGRPKSLGEALARHYSGK